MSGQPDPDSRARTHLANERTFLAWFRTGVTLTALGLAAAQLLDRGAVTGLPLVQLIASIAILTGFTFVWVGASRYRAARGRIDAAAFLPAGSAITGATIAAAGFAALALLFVWLLRQG